jgi:predicted dehydrogenase
VAVTGSAISSANEFFTFTIAFDQPYEAFYEIIGDQGSIRLDRAYTTPAELANSITIRCGDRVETRSVPPADHFQLMIEHVCQLIATGSDFAAEHRLIEERATTVEQMRLGCLRRNS